MTKLNCNETSVVFWPCLNMIQKLVAHVMVQAEDVSLWYVVLKVENLYIEYSI